MSRRDGVEDVAKTTVCALCEAVVPLDQAATLSLDGSIEFVCSPCDEAERQRRTESGPRPVHVPREFRREWDAMMVDAFGEDWQ